MLLSIVAQLKSGVNRGIQNKLSKMMKNTDPVGAKPVDKKSDRTRKTILKAAAKLFKEKGYTATTLRDIADDAGMKAGSIYYHFDSKDAIMDQVLDTGLRAVYDAVKGAVEACATEIDHSKKIDAAIHAHLKMLLSQGDFISANIRLYSQLPEDIRARHQKLRHEYADLWDGLLEDATKAGFLRKDMEIVPLRQFVLGALNWTIEWYDDDKYSLDTFADRCARFVAHGIYRQ